MAPVDYDAVLVELRGKRDKLNAAIAAIEELAGVVSSAVVETTDKGRDARQLRTATGGDLRSDSFFNMSTGDAAKKYLAMVKRPATVKEIHDGLLAGGMITTAKNFYANLYTAIRRTGEIINVPGNKWGLAEWYPGRRLEPSRPGGKRGGGSDAPIEAPTSEPAPPSEQSPGGAQE